MRHGPTSCRPSPSASEGVSRNPSLALGLGPEMPPNHAPWLVISDDWGRHPSSCQHLIRHLLPEQPVTWVNMIGTRRPAVDWATARRGLEKFGQGLGPAPPDTLPGNLRGVSPKGGPGVG